MLENTVSYQWFCEAVLPPRLQVSRESHDGIAVHLLCDQNCEAERCKGEAAMSLSLWLWDRRLTNKVCAPVEEFTGVFRIAVDDLKQTMYLSSGVGLSAPQVGIFFQYSVMNLGDPHKTVTMVNPVIEDSVGPEKPETEGCLSLPGVRVPVKRSSKIKVSYMDEFGESHSGEYSGWDARVIQHEVDHLNGIFCIDRCSRLVREMALGKFQKKARQLVPVK